MEITIKMTLWVGIPAGGLIFFSDGKIKYCERITNEPLSVSGLHNWDCSVFALRLNLNVYFAHICTKNIN